VITPHLYSQTLSRVSTEFPLIGMSLLRHRNARREPMSFRLRPYLIEWYVDFDSSTECTGADIVTVPQIGKTELFTQFVLHEAGWRNRLTAYAMPTAGLRDEFVKRINPLLVEVPEYRKRLPAKDLAALQQGGATDTGSMRSKRFGAGTMLFVSAKTNPDWVDYSVDTFVIDEYDHCLSESKSNVGKADDRLRASPRSRKYRMGNPEIPRGGIEALFDDGDQRLFHWRCPHCGERQPLSWLENFVSRDSAGNWELMDRAAAKDKSLEPRPICRRCREPFERDAAGACWIALSPSRERRSYRVTRYDDLGATIRQAWNEWVTAQPSTELTKLWWRGWEGIAWESSTSGITRSDIVDAAVLGAMQLEADPKLKGQTITAGIDVGSLFHITVTLADTGAAGRVERRALWTGTVRDPEQVHDVLKRFHVRTAVIDALPETRVAQGIRDEARKYDCDVWLCQFTKTDRAGADDFGMKRDNEARIVSVDRTQLLDAAADQIRLGGVAGRIYTEAGLVPPPSVDANADPRAQAVTWAVLEALRDPGAGRARLWPSDIDEVPEFIAQVLAPRRVLNSDGEVRWSEGSRPDHYRLADAYDLLAYEIDGRAAQVI
jgi:hypothetical protein